MSAEKTEALRLADELDGMTVNEFYEALGDEAAAELRRLLAENERLHQINQSHEMKLSVRGYEIQIADLEAQRGALLEALKEYGWHHEGCPQYPTYTHPDRWPACTCGFDAAIKAVEEST